MNHPWKVKPAPLLALLACVLATFSQPCRADEFAGAGSLMEVARSTLSQKVKRALEAEKGAKPAVINRRGVARIEAASQRTVDCFRVHAASYEKSDVQSFVGLLSQYTDAFDIPDWEDRLARVMDERYGPGSLQSRAKCSKAEVGSRDCTIAKSYEVVGVALYWKFAHCAVEGVNDGGRTGR